MFRVASTGVRRFSSLTNKNVQWKITLFYPTVRYHSDEYGDESITAGVHYNVIKIPETDISPELVKELEYINTHGRHYIRWKRHEDPSTLHGGLTRDWSKMLHTLFNDDEIIDFPIGPVLSIESLVATAEKIED